VALYTCDDSNCFLFRKGQSFDYGFACARTMPVTDPASPPRCAARELTIVDTSSPASLTSGAGSWGLDRSLASRGDDPHEAPTVTLESIEVPPKRAGPPVLLLALPLALLVAGAGAWIFREPLGRIAGLSDGGSGQPAAASADVESIVAEALLTAGYSREISDKILSVRRQVDAIRERNEAATPELASQLADVEAKIKQNEAERRAAFRSYVQSVERLSKLPAADVADATAGVGTRFDQSKLARLRALLPVLQRQVAAARAGNADHDRWIGEIETAPI